MQLKLKVLQGKSAGQLLEIVGPRFLVGKGSGCQLRPRSDAVADQQCAIEFEPARVCLRDLANNGATVVNGEPVTGMRELRGGEILKIGPLEFEVQVSTSLASKKAPKVQSPEDAANRLAAGRKKEMDVSAWLDDPADGESAAPPASNVRMSDEQRAELGLLTPEETSALAARKAAEAPPASTPNTQQTAADVLSKYFRKK